MPTTDLQDKTKATLVSTNETTNTKAVALPTEVPNVKSATKAETTVFFLAIINMVLAFFDYNPIPISDEMVYQGFSLVALVVSGLVTWWKDQDWKKETRVKKEVANTVVKDSDVKK